MAEQIELHVDKKMKKKKKFGLQKRGVMYIGHLPHGFYEDELKNFFSHFGEVHRIRVVRSRKTGRSKGYAFVEFKYEDVAKIAAETMNNFLLCDRILKCSYVPNPKKFWPEWKRSNFVSSSALYRSEHNSVKSDEKNVKREKKILEKLEKTKNALAGLGIKYTLNINTTRKNEREEEMEESLSKTPKEKDENSEAFEAKRKPVLGNKTAFDTNESLTQNEETLKRKKSRNKMKKNKIAKLENEIKIDDTNEVVIQNAKFSPQTTSIKTDVIGSDEEKISKQKENYETTLDDNYKGDVNLSFNDSVKTKKTKELSKESLENNSLIENDGNVKKTPRQTRESNAKPDIPKFEETHMDDTNDINAEYTKLTPKGNMENNNSLVSNKSSNKKKKKRSSSHNDLGEGTIKHTHQFNLENDESDKVTEISVKETKTIADITDVDAKTQTMSTPITVQTSKLYMSKSLSKRSPKLRSCKKSKQLNITGSCVVVEMPDEIEKEAGKNYIEFDDSKEKKDIQDIDINEDKKIIGILSNSEKKKRSPRFRSCKKQSAVKFDEKNLDRSKIKSDSHHSMDSSMKKATRNRRNLQALSSSYINDNMKTPLSKRSPKFRKCKKI